MVQGLRTDQVFFQLNDQLKVYYAQWRKSSDTKEALTRSSGVRKPLTDTIHDPSRSAAAPPIPFQPAKLHAVEKGFLEFDEGSSHPTLNSGCSASCPVPKYNDKTNTTGTQSLPTFSAQAQSTNTSPSSKRPKLPAITGPNALAMTARETVERLARKRVADSLAERPRKRPENVALV